MNVTVSFDWRVAVALGATAVAILLVDKMDSAAAEKVSTILADACREFVSSEQDTL